MRDIVHKYDQVVFGSNLHALMYAYVNQIPLFYCSTNRPKIFEFFDNTFEFANIANINTLIKNKKDYNFGMRKLELWKRLSFVLAYDGLMPLGNGIQFARLDDNLLKITTNNSRLLRISFNKMFLFNEDISGLPQQIKLNNKGKVYDYLNFMHLHEKKTMLIESKTNLVNRLWIHNKKAIAISNVQDITEDLPDYAVKMKILDIGKQYDIKGKQNGIYHYRKELKIPRFKKLDFRFYDRTFIKDKLNTYENSDDLHFIDSTPELETELLNKLTTSRTWNLLTT
jgi:hypothetical protein